MLKKEVPNYFKSRRDALAKKAPQAVFVFPSGPEHLRNPDVHHPFRQESSLYYLTGFEEPESVLVLREGKTSLFVRKRDPEKELWEGKRYGLEGAARIFGADEAYPIDELEARLPDLLAGASEVYTRLAVHPEWDAFFLRALEVARKRLGRSGKSLPAILDPNSVLGEMRLFKTSEEVACLRKAGEITAAAHVAAMRAARPGATEFEIEALVDYECRRHGASRMGYGSIVAGGENATCLHYRLNNEPLRDGDLLLIDAGCEVDSYTADITRTFPVGRTFSKEQAALYDLVLESQKAAIQMVKPGATIPGIHRRVQEILVEGALRLGLLQGDAEKILTDGGLRRYYPHSTSHWLGMDVHDVGAYLLEGQARALEPGMVLTIEPGFYVQPTDREALDAYRGIGIRIEDDVLVTAQGHDVLTRTAPKERAEIEAIKAGAK